MPTMLPSSEYEVAVPLATMSDGVKRIEAHEIRFQTVLHRHAEIRLLMQGGGFSDELNQEIILLDQQIENARKVIVHERQTVIEKMNAVIEGVTRAKETI